MKKILFVILTLLILTSCQNNNNDFIVYRKAQDYFNNETNYTIEENSNDTKTTYIYANNISYIKDEEKEVYLYTDSGECYIVAYNKDNDIFFREKIDLDDHYFYPYAFIERLSKIAAYINLNELKLKDNKFIGENFTGSYLYNGKLHSPIKIEIALQNNHIVSFYEEYMCDGLLEKDAIIVKEYGTSRIKLPLNVIDLDALNLTNE